MKTRTRRQRRGIKQTQRRRLHKGGGLWQTLRRRLGFIKSPFTAENTGGEAQRERRNNMLRRLKEFHPLS